MHDDDNLNYQAWLAAQDGDELTPEQERDCSAIVEKSWRGETLTPEEAQRLHYYMLDN